MDSRLQAEVRRRDDATVIDLHGEIDSTAAATLDGAYTETVGGAPTVLLNFADVQYINSTGIALIVGLLARARTEGRTVRACGLMPHYQEIFQITRLADFMGIFPDEDSAVSAVPATT